MDGGNPWDPEAHIKYWWLQYNKSVFSRRFLDIFVGIHSISFFEGSILLNVNSGGSLQRRELQANVFLGTETFLPREAAVDRRKCCITYINKIEDISWDNFIIWKFKDLDNVMKGKILCVNKTVRFGAIQNGYHKRS